MSSNFFPRYGLLLILLLTLIVYFPSLNNDFVNWDDTDYIENIYIRHLNWNNVKDIFNPSGNVDKGNYYHPLLLFSLALDCFFWKANPTGFHITNLMIFLITLLLIYFITMKLFENRYISLITALLFAIHPIHTEPVAWITGRAHLLTGIFSLTSFYLFILSNKNNKIYLYTFLSSLSFIFAILSHPFSLFLPLVFLLYQHSFPSQLMGKKIKVILLSPFFFIAIAFEPVLFLLHSQEKRIPLVPPGIGENICNSFTIFSKYCNLIFWPAGLSALYNIKDYISPVIYIFSILLILTLLYSSIKDKKMLFAAGWFMIFYLPASNLLFPLDLIMGDRYIYLSSFGLFLWISMIGHRIVQERSSYKTLILAGLIIIVIILSYMSGERCYVWKNGLTLWDDVLKKYPNPVAYNNRGIMYGEKGDYNKGMKDFNRALSLDPYNEEAYDNRGILYVKAGNYEEAINNFNMAIHLNPGSRKAYNNRGKAYSRTENYEKALQDYNQALKININDPTTYKNRGTLYFETGNYEEALKDYTLALKSNPHDPEALYKRAIIYYVLKKYDESWKDVYEVQASGYQPEPAFLEALRKASR